MPIISKFSTFYSWGKFYYLQVKKKKDPDIGIDGFDKQIRYSQETSYIPRNKIMESTKISLYN